MKYNPAINFVVLTTLITSVVMSGCYRQKVYVYEKIPEANECRRYSEYFPVSNCNRKHHFAISKKLYRAIQITNYRLKRKFNQKVKCTHKSNRPVPTGCYLPYLPSRFNLPTHGKTPD